jgi:Ca2+-binding RTX toxin-like protein
MFESLETRTLMSASLNNGVLTITETNGADTVVVGKNPQGKFFVTENGIPSLFLWNAVNKVVVNLLAGADNFSAQPVVDKPLEIHGGDGNDTEKGGSGNDMLFGDNGDDLLDGRGGNDDTHGGAGVDTADYSDRTANLNISLDDVNNDGGPGGHDNIHSDIENVLGGYGNDMIVGSAADNMICGGGGDDVIKGLGGNDNLDGGVGGVAVYAQNTGNDRIEGGDGNDIINASDYGNCSMYGGAGNDWIYGWQGNDYIDGGDGDDVCHGYTGNDVIYGGTGSDYLYGEGGNDVINGDNGNSIFHNILRFPSVKFKALQPILINPIIGVSGGTAGATPTTLATTQIMGPVAKPALSLTGIITKLPPILIFPPINFVTYDDWISGGDGNDTVRGNEGNDTCTGDAGNDYVYGDAGNDNLSGNDGNDNLYGGAGNDFLSGGNGDDVLVTIGGGSMDTCAGNAGRDEFWMDDSPNEWLADGDFWSEYLGGTVHKVGSFANGASKELNGQNLADPDGSNNRPAVTYNPDWNNFSSHPLFADSGPSRDDIVQGQVGDCYFLAGLSSTAKVDPQRIKNCVVDLGDGTYGVQFFRNGAWQYYRVDGDLPCYQGTTSLYYANFGTGQSMWVPIMEKAFTEFRSGANSYNSIHGGNSNEPYNALAGSPSGISVSNLLDIKKALLDGKAVSVSTPNSDPPAGTHAVKWHVYSVVSVQTVSYQLPFIGTIEVPISITLRNPWGTDGGGNNDGSDDGYVTFTASQFTGYFNGATASYM